jgi:hypothetical protein
MPLITSVIAHPVLSSHPVDVEVVEAFDVDDVDFNELVVVLLTVLDDVVT